VSFAPLSSVLGQSSDPQPPDAAPAGEYGKIAVGGRAIPAPLYPLSVLTMCWLEMASARQRGECARRPARPLAGLGRTGL